MQKSKLFRNHSRGWIITLGGMVMSILIVSVLFKINTSQAQEILPTDWGSLINVPFETNYAIYTQSFSYADPFLVTDLRSGDTNPVESYDIHRLDIYRPAIADELLQNRPVVFFVHGGGWTEGYKNWFRSLSWSFTGQMGWITVVIDYRLTGYEVFIADQYCPDRATCNLPANETLRTKAAEYPDNIQDVAAAFTWTRDWINEQGGNPKLIFGLGYSAGAHLLALMATHPDYANLSPSMRAMAALSGPYDLVGSDFKTAYMYVLAPTFGVPLNDAELADASPQIQISGVDWLPPAMLLYAEHDLPYLNEHTLHLAESIRQKGLPVDVVYLENNSHSREIGDLPYVERYATQRIIGFFENQLPSSYFLPLFRR